MEHKKTERASEVPNKRGGNGEISSRKCKTKEYSNKQIMEATERKSKLKHLVVTSYDNTLDMRNQQPYMNTNNRGECSAIFRSSVREL